MESILKKDKKGVSVMVGYVLLVVFALIISAGVYQWLKSFVPADAVDCPDGTSVYLRAANYSSSTGKMMIEIVNNGLFNISGYFIHVTNDAAQEVPDIDISSYLSSESTVIASGGSVLFVVGKEVNPFGPGDSETHVFDLSGSEVGTPYLVGVIPTRQQENRGRKILAGCASARVEQSVESV